MSLPPAETLLEVMRGARVGVALVDTDGRYLYVNDALGGMHGRDPEQHLGLTIRDVMPEIADAVEELIERAIRTGAPVLGASVSAEDDETTAAWEASYVPVRVGDRDAVGILVADTSERERAVAETRRRLSQQAALADLGQLGLREPDPEVVVAAATEMVVRELGAEMSTVARPDPVTGKLMVAAGTGWPPGAIERYQADAAQNPVSSSMLRNEVSISADALADERTPPLLTELGIRSVIAVPIPGSDGPLGVLAALSRRPGLFGEADTGFMRGTANVLGASIVRAEHERQLAGVAALRGRLVAETLDTGEREQRELAGVLHEDVLQHLLFARLEAAGLQAEDGDRARIVESLDSASRLVREVVAALSPPILSHAGLTAALEALCRQTEHRCGARIELDVDPACEGVADDLVHTAVRELLDELAGQPGTGHGRVAVTTTSGGLAIHVSCDAPGVGPEQVRSAMRGASARLARLHERTIALGGAVEVSAGPGGRGAAIELSVPR